MFLESKITEFYRMPDNFAKNFRYNRKLLD